MPPTEPDDIPIVDARAPARRPRARLAILVVAIAVVVGAVAGGVALVLTRDGEDPDAPTLLARARRHVEKSGNYAFEGRFRLEAEEPGGSFVQRVRLEGVADLPDRSRFLALESDTASEIITIGKTMYVRTAKERAGLTEEKWGRFDDDEQDASSGVLRFGDGVDPGEAGEPGNLLRTIRAARSPTIVRREGDITILRAEVDIDSAFGTAAELDKVTLELTVADDGRLDRVITSVIAEGTEVSSDVRLSKWGERVRIAAPAASQLDPTPGIDEEAVAAYADAPLLQPRRIPEGWVLDGADVIEAEDTPEDCRQVAVDYTDPDDPEAGYLSLYEMPVSCRGEQPRGARPFSAGRYRGFVELDNDAVYATITVGRTVVQAETDLEPEQLSRILADLVPLDLSKPPDASARLGSA